MTMLELPDTFDLRTAPELGALALLDAALAVADQVLRREHAQLDTALERPGVERAPEVIAAYLLVHNMRNLRCLLALYGVAVRRAMNHGIDDLPF